MADLKIALSIDANNPIVGDLYLENGDVRLTKTLIEEVAQLLYIRFRFFQGEWFLDTTQGIPYFQSILGQKTPIAILQNIFSNVIKTCPGVQSLQSFNLQRLPKRKLQVNFVALLKDGTTLNSADFAPFIVGGTT